MFCKKNAIPTHFGIPPKETKGKFSQKITSKILKFDFWNLHNKAFSSKSIWQIFQLQSVLLILNLIMPMWSAVRPKKFLECGCCFWVLLTTHLWVAKSGVRVIFWVPRCCFSKSSQRIETFSYIGRYYRTSWKKVMFIWKSVVLAIFWLSPPF